MKLTHTRIVTNDMPALAAFYQDVTGITPVGVEDYLEFRSPVGTLAITTKVKVDAYNAGAAEAASNRSSIIEFRVDDVDEEYERLKHRVDKFELEPTTQPWGNRSMLFRDPDGNLINFFAPLGNQSGGN